jgi:site-specific recombinase XerD
VKTLRARGLACNKAVETAVFHATNRGLRRGTALRTIQRAGPNSADRWLADFLGQLQRDDLAPATVRGYRYDLRLFLRWFNHAKGSPARFEKLSAIDLINYRQHLLKVEGLRPATVNRRLEALRRFCRWAQQSKRVKANVALDLRPARTVRNTRPVGLSEPEVHTLLRLAGESGHGLATRNYALVQLMVQAGLRVGEVAALRIADITARERSDWYASERAKASMRAKSRSMRPRGAHCACTWTPAAVPEPQSRCF